MKNIYICALTLFVSSTLIAQNKIQKGFENIQSQLTTDVKQEAKPIKNIPNDKAPGDTLWSEDFTGGLPTGWYVQDNTGNNYDWVINSGDISNINSTPSGYTNSTAITSNSGGNYMLLFSGEYNRFATPIGNEVDMDSYFQTAGIQVNNAPALSVSFQQKNRRCCGVSSAPVSVLSVSTDSTFATNFQEYDIIGGLSNNIQSPDPMNMDINISAIAANYTGKIWLRIHLKSGYSHYYWMIDDMALVEPPANDILTTTASYGFTPVGTNGFQYTRIPLAHIQPIDFSMIAENIGSANQTSTNLTVDINDGTASVFNQSTPNFTLNQFDIDTLEMFGAWTPTATVGIPYTVTMDVFSDSTDFTPSNNTTTFPPFEVSQYTYAMDDYIPDSSGSSSFPQVPVEYEIGNYFEAVVDDIATGVEFLVDYNSNIGVSVNAVLYRYSGGDHIEIARSSNHIVTAADMTTPKTLHLVDTATRTSPNIQKDSLYFAGIYSFATAFRCASSGTSPIGSIYRTHSMTYLPTAGAPTTTYNPTRIPMIRLITDPIYLTVNEQKNKVKFKIFPNPSNGVFNINISSVLENNINLMVKNVIGQTILTKTLTISGETNHQISLADYSKGIYFLTISNKTVKLIVD